MSTIQLTIAEPCNKDWTNMRGDEQGRFCNSCKKNVLDFTVMDDKEIYNTILKSDADICGRFNQTQLDKAIQYEAEKKQRWHKYLFSFLVPAFLFAKQTAAQKKMGKVAVTPTVCNIVTMGMVARTPVEKRFRFSGVIIDAANKEMIGNATLQIKGGSKGVVTDSAGNFILTAKTSAHEIKVIISAIGFKTKEIEMVIPVNDFMVPDEIISLQKEVKLLGEVVVNSNAGKYLSGVMGGLMVSVRINKYTLASTRLITAINDSIKIYPNPVQRGSSFSVALKLKQKGNYTLQVVDAAGRLLMQQQINSNGKTHQQNIQCNEKWNNGIYFLRVAGYGNKLAANSRFVIK